MHVSHGLPPEHLTFRLRQVSQLHWKQVRRLFSPTSFVAAHLCSTHARAARTPGALALALAMIASGATNETHDVWQSPDLSHSRDHCSDDESRKNLEVAKCQPRRLARRRSRKRERGGWGRGAEVGEKRMPEDTTIYCGCRYSRRQGQNAAITNSAKDYVARKPAGLCLRLGKYLQCHSERV